MQTFGSSTGKPVPVNPPDMTQVIKPPKIDKTQVIKPPKAGLVSKEQLKEFGWLNTSDKEVKKINRALKTYGIKSKESIAFFMATVRAETDGGYYNLEDYDKKIAKDNYERENRGAGYIQLTGEDNQENFLKAIEKDYQGKNLAEEVAKYPWLASAWYWSGGELEGEKTCKDLNAYVNENGTSIEVFLITQYFVNTFPKGSNDDLVYIKTGGKYKIELPKDKEERGNLIILNTDGTFKASYKLPKHWEKRKKAYEDAKKIFLK